MTDSKPHTPDVPREPEDWVVSLDFASDSDDELDVLLPQFEQWQDAAPENRTRFAAAQQHWDMLLTLDRADWGLDELPEPAPAVKQKTPTRSTALAWRWASGLAALLIIACGAWLYVRFGDHLFCRAPFRLTDGQCTLSEGRQASSDHAPAQFVLGDGTRVTLTGELTVSLTAQHRQVFLQSGQATFIVAKKDTPFWVTAGITRVRAVGTEFSVSRTGPDASSTRVTVGTVEIFAADQHGFVHDGQSGDFDGARLTVHLTDHMRTYLGPDGSRMLQFDGAPVDDAVREFNRYNPHNILIADDPIARRTIGGTFPASDPDEFAEVIDATFKSKHTISSDRVHGVRVIRLTEKKQGKTPVNARPPGGGTETLEKNETR